MHVSALLDRNIFRGFRFIAMALLGALPMLAGAASVSTNFSQKQAYWMDRSRVVIPAADYTSGNTYSIVTSPTGGITLNSAKTGLTGGTESSIPLTLGGALTAAELVKYPQLSTYTVFTVSSAVPLATLESALTGQMVFSSVNSGGTLTYATGLQYGAVLDDLYYYPGCLGVVMNANTTCDDATNPNGASIQVRVWAPTAKTVSLLLYNSETQSPSAPTSTVTMREVNGVWSADGTSAWVGMYYMFSVNVYVPNTGAGAIDTNITTDPYSIDQAPNGTLSRITNLDAAGNKPPGWDASTSPALNSMNDLSVYELHVRDFSVGDPTVPAAHSGTYDAFADSSSNGMQHLAALARSGLKAVHILPTFYFSSSDVNEVAANWVPVPNLTGDPPSSELQEQAVTANQGKGPYNWGYDPIHYMTPEGAYAMNPDNRVYEYRVMVMGLHNAGLRVIQDQVFNHTNASGEGTNSNLDEVVPNYYHRFNATGTLDTASCCADTASEHLMMEKLMIDTVVQNAKEYKIDGYRFDLMCLHFTYNVQHMYQALQALTVENSGVNGSMIYLYGEGWNFGETANNAIGPAATQVGMQGFGAGTFNDRIRDSVRGDDGADQTQGFSTGLATDPSAYTTANTTLAAQNLALLQADDLIRVGLTGNLANYTFTSYTGATTTGAGVNYNGSQGGYTSAPIEAIQYVSVHDNQLLFDAVQEKASLNDSSATRARRQALAMSVIELSQGIPFFAGGDDMLRSKDMDQNSYNSGDWFNKIDWSGAGDNWGIGLPVASQNSSQWAFETPLLSNAMYTPQPADIALTTAVFQEFLQIRYSSELFRMTTLAQIQRQLLFLNTGPTQTPGLIVMELKTPPSGPVGKIVVVFNATMQQQAYSSSALVGLNLELHPVQQSSADPIARTATFTSSTGTVTVPALTTSVFVSH